MWGCAGKATLTLLNFQLAGGTVPTVAHLATGVLPAVQKVATHILAPQHGTLATARLLTAKEDVCQNPRTKLGDKYHAFYLKTLQFVKDGE